MRSFIAIEIPEALRQKIHETFSPLRRQIKGVKWVEPSHIHLTLQFLGEIDEALIEQELIPRLEALSHRQAPLSLSIHGVGLFPSLEKPRIFWVGIGGESILLKHLQMKLKKTLENLPLHEEAEEFHAHLTLGRVRQTQGKKLWPKLLEEYEKVELGAFAAREMVLFKSELTSTGPVYTKFKVFPFCL